MVLLIAGGLFFCSASNIFAGVVGSPHDFSSTGPYTTTLATGGVCSICHIPHGAKDAILWPRYLGDNISTGYRGKLKLADGSGDNNYIYGNTLQCYDCHDYAGDPNPFTGDSTVYEQNVFDTNDLADPPKGSFTARHRPQDVAFGLLYKTPLPPAGGYDGDWTDDGPGGTVTGYFENDPPYNSPGRDFTRFGVGNPTGTPRVGGHYFKSGDPISTGTNPLKVGDKIPCSDCHDPHDYTAQAFVRKKVREIPGAPSPLDRASEYMSNRGPTGRSRNNAESRNLCNACHTLVGSGSPITYNQINTGYQSVNVVQRPNTIAEHLAVSNAPCTQCHSHNNIFASCGQCHGYPPSSTANPAYPTSPRFVPSAPVDNDSHPRHYGASSGQTRTDLYRLDCDVCHYLSTGAGTQAGIHQDNLVSVILQGGWTSKGSGYDNANYYNRDANLPPAYTGSLDNSANKVNSGGPPGGWGNGSRLGGNACQNVYCHSAGRAPSSMSPGNDNDYRRPTWNSGRQHCNDCHGIGTDNTTNDGVHFGMPDYPSGNAGSASANSHRKHIDAGYECYVCHAGTVDNNYSGPNRRILTTTPTKHVNGLREVMFDGDVAKNGSRNPPYDNAINQKTCSVSCHGSALPKWGGTLANGCFDCHTGTEMITKPQDNVGIPNPVDNNEYLYSGHGRSGSNYPGDNNAAAGFSNYTVAPVDCYYCHSQNAAHTNKSTSDPFRLGYDNDATGQKGTLKGAFADNTDLLCLGCHGTSELRLNHDNAAKGTTTVDAQTHARGITGTKYDWPGPNYPWKCVDCHDPHGDGKSGSERYMMIRSGINAPTGSGDTGAGSDTKSRPKNNGANVLPVSFNSRAGYSTTAGVYSYANQGDSAPWGPCEVCHTQTTAYRRTLLDNTSTHATRTNQCVTCHPHNAGFAAKACKGCHGGDNGDPGQVSGNAPNITKYWITKGHGKTSGPAMNLECEACHDVGYRTANDHKTDGSVPNNPPNNINTLHWPVPEKVPLNDNTNPNVNTAHLKSAYFKASPATRAEIAATFDNFCALACHQRDYHRHCQPNSCPDNAMRFGDQNTVSNPKAYSWYALGTYVDDFYKSRSPWTDNDISLVTGLSDSSTSYGTCVSCHDPHGTAATDNSFATGIGTTNHMLRGNWKTDTDNFCNKACHTNRAAP